MFLMVMDMADSPKDQRKIEKLYEKYNRLMYVIAYNIVQHHEDAEDVVLAAWERIIKNLDKISKIDCQETKALIVIIVERIAIDFYRRNKRTLSRIIYKDDCEMYPIYGMKDAKLDEVEMHQVLQNIPKKYAEVLILYYVNGYKSREIASFLNITESNVTQRLSRARKFLRKELTGDE